MLHFSHTSDIPAGQSARPQKSSEYTSEYKSAASCKSSEQKPAGAKGRRRFPPVVFVLAAVFALLTARLLFASPPSFLLSENKKFERFAREVFRDEMSANTLNLHYTVADPDAYGIKTKEVSLGDASLRAQKQACAAAENYLSRLDSFDYQKLSHNHQVTYDIFRSELETQLQGADFLLYDEPLSPALGIQAQLPILFAEYAFRTKGDVEDYLALLAQVPDYFSSVLSFERQKAASGLFMSRGCADEVIKQCEDFIADPENNFLITIFNERIDAFSNLTADEKIAYRERNRAILQGYVIPAYQSLIDGISRCAADSKNEGGLYYLPDGAGYYRWLVKSTVGDSRSVEEIEEAVKVQMVADYAAIQELMKETQANTALSAGTTWKQSPANGPSAMLDELRQKITQDFPLLPEVSCTVKYVHPSLQPYLSPAFYLTPAIDDWQNNVIYINPASDYDDLELFTTLAHEGYPGHLYQSVCFSALQPDLLRSLLETGGYTEGWATYVEMYAYSLWEDDPQLAELCRRNRSFTLGLASLLDIGIHYRGYSLQEVSQFLAKFGFSADTAASLYQNILQTPANYLKYYVGCLNFCALRDEMRTAAGSQFSLRDFHQAVLETGPAPFDILRQEVENRLAKRTGQTKSAAQS